MKTDGFIRLATVLQLFSNACRLRAMPDAMLSTLKTIQSQATSTLPRAECTCPFLPTIDSPSTKCTNTLYRQQQDVSTYEHCDLLQDAPFESKSRIAMLTPHADKVPLMDNAIRAPRLDSLR